MILVEKCFSLAEIKIQKNKFSNMSSETLTVNMPLKHFWK